MDIAPSISALGTETIRADNSERVVAAAMMLNGLKLAKRPREVPRSRYPILDEIDYGNRLVAMTIEKMRPLYLELAELFPRSSSDSLAADEDPLVARRILETLRERAVGSINIAEMERLAAFYGDRVSKRGREQLANQLRTGLGVEIPVVDTKRIQDLARFFARDNAGLIVTIPENLHADVANLTMRAFANKLSRRDFVAQLAERFDVSEARARFIARDQIGKLNAAMAEERNRALGIDAYFWRTRRDKRVRKEHRKKEGKRFLYDSPPKGGHAGHPPGCRCVQEPDLSGILDQIEEAKRFKRRAGLARSGARRRAELPRPAPPPPPKRRAAPRPRPAPQPPAPPQAAAAEAVEALRRGDINAARHAIEADLRAQYRLGSGDQAAAAGNRTSRTFVSDQGMDLPGGVRARGLHHWDGAIQLSSTVARDAQQFAAAWNADPEALRDQLRSIDDPFITAHGPIGRARDAAAGVDGLRVIVHEAIHGFGPMRASNYVGVDAHVEELATETLARRYVADRYGARMRLRRRGSYWEQIDEAIEAIREVYNIADASRQWELLERGAMAFKGASDAAGRDLVAILADAIALAHGGHDQSDALELVLRRRLGRI